MLELEFVVQGSAEWRNGVTEELGHADFAVAKVRRDREHTSRPQDPAQFRENDGKFLSPYVLERIERDGSGAGIGTERETPHVGADAAHWCVLASKREHPGRQVQSDHGQAPIRQVPAHLARAGAHIDGDSVADAGSGRVQDESVNGKLREVVAEHAGVILRDRVVRGGDRVR